MGTTVISVSERSCKGIPAYMCALMEHILFSLSSNLVRHLEWPPLQPLNALGGNQNVTADEMGFGVLHSLEDKPRRKL